MVLPIKSTNTTKKRKKIILIVSLSKKIKINSLSTLFNFEQTNNKIFLI